MSDDEIEEAMDVNVGDGLFSKQVDESTGEQLYSLTDQGQAQAADLMGGPDVAHSAEALSALIKEHGTLLGPLNDAQEREFGMWTWVVAQRCAEIIRWALEQSPTGKAAWLQTVFILENELARLKPGVFEHRGRAVPTWPPE